jgi:hypothetical protein
MVEDEKRGLCRYAHRSEEAYEQGSNEHRWRPVEGPMLCAWAMDAAPDKLVNVPRWLQRNALAGHLLRYPDDCMGCPCYEARP